MRSTIASLWRSVGFPRLSPNPNQQGFYSRWTNQCSRRYAHMVDFQSRLSNGNQLLQTQQQQQPASTRLDPTMWALSKVQEASRSLNHSRDEEMYLRKNRIGDNISSRDKNKLLIDVLHGLDNSKEAVYGALDAWVAWERNFPISRLKNALLSLQIGGHWHRTIQVIKWMLSKGQGNTMGTYEQLIQALDKDNRAEEAHSVWVRKISYDLHPVPWRVCELMISIYYRNNMLERLVKLFKGLEEFDRKPRKKSVVRKVSDAYEMLGLLEEKDRILEKYSYLFVETPEKLPKKMRKTSKKMKIGKIDRGISKASDNGPVAGCPTNTEASAR